MELTEKQQVKYEKLIEGKNLTESQNRITKICNISRRWFRLEC